MALPLFNLRDWKRTMKWLVRNLALLFLYLPLDSVGYMLLSFLQFCFSFLLKQLLLLDLKGQVFFFLLIQ